MVNLSSYGIYDEKKYVVVNTEFSDSVNNQIAKLIDRGFLSLFVTHRKYRGKIRVKLTYSGMYHCITTIDSLDEYNNVVAVLLSNLLNCAIQVGGFDNLDLLQRELRNMKLGMNRTSYRGNTQIITLTKLIPKQHNDSISFDLNIQPRFA